MVLWIFIVVSWTCLFTPLATSSWTHLQINCFLFIFFDGDLRYWPGGSRVLHSPLLYLLPHEGSEHLSHFFSALFFRPCCSLCSSVMKKCSMLILYWFLHKYSCTGLKFNPSFLTQIEFNLILIFCPCIIAWIHRIKHLFHVSSWPASIESSLPLSSRGITN